MSRLVVVFAAAGLVGGCGGSAPAGADGAPVADGGGTGDASSSATDGGDAATAATDGGDAATAPATDGGDAGATAVDGASDGALPSDGAPPSGDGGLADGGFAGLALHPCAPFAVTPGPNPSPSSFDYQFAVSGPCHVFVGHDIWLLLTATQTAGTPTHVQLQVSGLPPGATYAFPDLERTCCGKGTSAYEWTPQTTSIQITVPSTVAPGDYTITIQASSNNVTKTASGPISVVATPPTLTPPTIANPPPIPLLSTWQSNMTTFGRKWCNQQQIDMLGTVDQSVQYYDGERVYYQIADYTNDSSWYTCGGYVATVYRTNYVMPNQGKIPGYRVFPKGSFLEYKRIGTQEAHDAVLLLAQNSAFAGTMTAVDPVRVRENAYLIWAALLARDLGDTTQDANITRYVDFALGHLDQWFIAKNYSGYMQPFMVGLNTEALIEYWSRTHDPRIPYVVKAAADGLWKQAWYPNTDPALFTMCSKPPDRTSEAFYYISQFVSGEGDPCGVKYDLNLLIAPTYAWLYRISGDATYQMEADAIWHGGVYQAGTGGSYGAAVDWDGKIFSQNYRRSFDFVKWRMGQ